ncbi:4Fe-4S cluster-binding domain-containing protein [Sphaerisporangium rubeum]|uniref:Anaerobic ribonucleoside-triphosphate reductase activating protein n=1 Tax=Sphaerisporangium rubeum TaxID=321317 RepID=A0A7X0IGA9_9ACTN|nr:4Fe-4S single cluster domain-containing protein [Sphaerisporangium rubeum]MBB6473157.1 anaerobic ribonucleoside-triphosphate reductase activating protein [Sphaerisporangium rubeum]
MAWLRVSRTYYPVTALGPGRRLGVWTQGCPLACRGCMSRHTWDPGDGERVPVTRLLSLWRRALAAGATGLTVSGGEPLTQPDALVELLSGARDAGDGAADILLYTGYEPAEFDEAMRAAADQADALITGRYDVGRPTRLLWRGSANQRLIVNTGLGRARFGPYETAEVDRAPVQVVLGEQDDLLFIGVPPPGALGRMERALAEQSVHLRDVSWRP